MKLYAIYEVTPSKDGDIERLIISRDRREDIEKIFKILQETNISFDYYRIKEIEG